MKKVGKKPLDASQKIRVVEVSWMTWKRSTFQKLAVIASRKISYFWKNMVEKIQCR